MLQIQSLFYSEILLKSLNYAQFYSFMHAILIQSLFSMIFARYN